LEGRSSPRLRNVIEDVILSTLARMPSLESHLQLGILPVSFSLAFPLPVTVHLIRGVLPGVSQGCFRGLSGGGGAEPQVYDLGAVLLEDGVGFW